MQRRKPAGPGAPRRASPGRAAGARADARRATDSVRVSGRPDARRTHDSGRVPGGARPAAAGARPAGPRRTGRPGARAAAAAPPRRLTARAGILMVLLLALALGYTYPVRQLLNQQAEIDRLRAANAAKRESIEELRDKAAMWRDEAYVETQARRRFFMVEPGEEVYVVFDRGELPPPAAGERPAAPSWSTQLWNSVAAADAAPRP
ncbi:MAG TPA: septum formation initiator family protein [Pilimelia sp.]|nr:septum formation initiator family protein [Pilimelia sp.]